MPAVCAEERTPLSVLAIVLGLQCRSQYNTRPRTRSQTRLSLVHDASFRGEKVGGGRELSPTQLANRGRRFLPVPFVASHRASLLHVLHKPTC